MNLEEKLIHNNKVIDDILNSNVMVYFVYEVNNKILVNLNEELPSVILLKKELHEDIIKSKAFELFGQEIISLEQIDNDNMNTRYYKIRFNDIYINDNYKYIESNNG